MIERARDRARLRTRVEAAMRVVGGEGACNRERLADRVSAWDNGAWVRDAALAHARKQQTQAQAA